jgi:ubiquitin thioesterase protein OTUB1
MFAPTALGFAFVEQILKAPENDIAAVSALSLLETTSSSLEAVGFHRIVFEDFYDVLYGLIKSVVQPDDGQACLTPASLLQQFQIPEGASRYFATWCPVH